MRGDALYWEGTDNHPPETGYVNKGYWKTNIRGSYTSGEDRGMLSTVQIGFGVNNLFKTEPETVFMYDGEVTGLTRISKPAYNPRLQFD